MKTARHEGEVIEIVEFVAQVQVRSFKALVAIEAQDVAEFVTLESLAEPGRRLFDMFLKRAQVGAEIGDPPIPEEAVFAQPQRGAAIFIVDLRAATERLGQEVPSAVGEERAAVGLLGEDGGIERVPGELALPGCRRAIGTILVPKQIEGQPQAAREQPRVEDGKALVPDAQPLALAAVREVALLAVSGARMLALRLVALFQFPPPSAQAQARQGLGTALAARK